MQFSQGQSATARPPRLYGRRAARGGLAPCAWFLTALILTSGPGAAYPLETGGFTDGTDSSLVYFDPLSTEVAGPSIRLLTNSSVTAGSVTLAGRTAFVNSTWQETSTTDFASNRRADSINITGGTMTLARGSGLITLDSSNAFGNASLTDTVLSAGTVVLSGSASGSFLSENLTAPTTGWGALLVYAALPSGTNISADVLAPNETVLVTDQAIGGLVNLDSIVYPALRLKLVLTGPDSSTSPAVSGVTLGQTAGETFVGTGVNRTLQNLTAQSGGYGLYLAANYFQEHPTSPYIGAVSNTYYSRQVYHGNFLNRNGTWHMFAAVYNSTSDNGVDIGHATSTDFENWTWDATPVLLNGTSGFDLYRVDHPWVIPDPASSGYLMYYDGWATRTKSAVGLATSPDLVNWTKYGSNPVLTNSSTGWDNFDSTSAVVAYENGTYRMWYAGTTVTTGGGHSLGYANSTDGRNWTKYGSNPVLSRGGVGSYDQDDFALQTVRLWNGTYYGYFACHNSVQYQACLATSPDGLNNWTKSSANPVWVPQSAQWESKNIYPNDVLPNGGNFTVIYCGADATNAWQMGRLDAAYRPGSATARLDFGTRTPLSLDAVSADVSVPLGARASVFLRSSANATNWSAWENLTTSSLVTATAAARYVEWRVEMTGIAQSGTPVLRGLTLRYSNYHASGRYESSLFTYTDAISAAALAASPAPANGTIVTLDLSNDDGVSWIRVTNNTLTNITTSGTSLLYAINLEGKANATPVIDFVNLTVQRRAFPENVSVRLGVNGTRFFNASGVFDFAINVSLPLSDLNAAIATTRTQYPSASSVDLPFIVTSSHFGTVEVREPRVTQALKNPLSATFLPAGTAVSMNENETLRFSVAATSFPSSVKVNTTWSLNGSVLPALQDKAQYNFTADFFMAGVHTIRCDVENGDFAYNRTWTLTVLNVNRLPTFGLLAPATPFTVSHYATTQFTAVGSDADLEALTYEWLLDGAAVGSGGTSVNLSNLFVGTRYLSAVLRDPYGASIHQWVINATNLAPALTYADPAPVVSLSHAATQTFTASASDGDGEPLAYSWMLDGVPLSTTLATATLTRLTVGSHVLLFSASDPFASTRWVWRIASTNDPPQLLSLQPPDGVTASHTSGLTFQAAGSDADGDALTYRWFVDGSLRPGGSDSFALTPIGFGAHTARVEASDGYAVASLGWNFTGTNAAPVSTVVIPAGNFSASHTARVQFEAQFTDGDGDFVRREWFFDGMFQGLGSSFAYSPLGLGIHTVRVEASDGYTSAVVVWVVTGTNSAPAVVATPSTEVNVSLIDKFELRVTGTDDDGDALSYAWTFGGVSMNVSIGNVSLGPLAQGTYEVRARVFDGLTETVVLFRITVTDRPPDIVWADPDVSEIAMAHNARLTVAVRAVDYEGRALTYRWTLGTDTLAAPSNSTSLGPLPEGLYTLAVEVQDGNSVGRRVWTVRATNSAPMFSGVAPPAGPVDAEAFQEIVFTARALDVDGDPVTLVWTVDNAPRNVSGELRITWNTASLHTVSLDAVSTGHVATLRWNVTVHAVNLPPTLRGASPDYDSLETRQDKPVAFVVVIDDDGLLPLTVEWRLDGLVVGRGTGFVFAGNATALGVHNLTATISDGEFTVERTWTVQVLAPQGAPGLDGAAAAAGLCAAALTATFVRRRGRTGE